MVVGNQYVRLLNTVTEKEQYKNRKNTYQANQVKRKHRIK